MGRLAGKVAVITGGAGVIGRTAVKLFVGQGARVLVADRDEAAVQAVVGDLADDRAGAFVGDVTSPADNEAMVAAAVERFGSLDVLLANAGVEGSVGLIPESDPGEFDRVMAINVKGPFLALRAAFPVMAATGGGSVVITSSGAGVKGQPGMAIYTASKAAVVGLMRTAALEGAAHNIRVNTIHPSAIESEMMSRVEHAMDPMDQQAVRDAAIAALPFGRYGRPDEIANVMLFLASDESSWISGSVQMIDGAETA